MDFRKLLLDLYRLLHFNDPIPNIKLNLKNRDKQLCKPIIRLFQGTEAVGEIKASLWKLIQEKRNRKAGTLEARFSKILLNLVNKSEQKSLDGDQVLVTSDDIWTQVKAEIKGTEIKQSLETEEYGTISRKKIASILESKFLGESVKNSQGSTEFRFSKKKLERIAANYSDDGIKIITTEKLVKQSFNGVYGASRASTVDSKHSETPITSENCENYIPTIENKQDNDKSVENIATKTNEDSEHSHNPPEGPEAPLSNRLNDVEPSIMETDLKDDKSYGSPAK